MTDVFVVVLDTNMVQDEFDAVIETGLEAMGWLKEGKPPLHWSTQRVDIEP